MTKNYRVADEGSYYVAQNATDGTGIAGHAAPVQADTDTKALLHIFNGGQSRIYLDYLRLRMTAIGGGASTTDFAIYVDNKGSTAYSSGGTTITPANVNRDTDCGTEATIKFGPVVTVTGFTKIGHQRVRSVVPVVEDQYVFTFGKPSQVPVSALSTTGTAVCQTITAFPPIVIVSEGNFNFTQWGTSQSGAHSFEFELGYWEL
jgi:hypothetical protein